MGDSGGKLRLAPASKLRRIVDHSDTVHLVAQSPSRTLAWAVVPNQTVDPPLSARVELSFGVTVDLSGTLRWGLCGFAGADARERQNRGLFSRQRFAIFGGAATEPHPQSFGITTPRPTRRRAFGFETEL